MTQPFVDRRPLAKRPSFRLGVPSLFTYGVMWLSWFVRVDGANWIVQGVVISLVAIVGFEWGVRMTQDWWTNHAQWYQQQAPVPSEVLGNAWGWGNTWILSLWVIWIFGIYHPWWQFWVLCLVVWNLFSYMAWLGCGLAMPRPKKTS